MEMLVGNGLLDDAALKDELVKIGEALGARYLRDAAKEIRLTTAKAIAMAALQPRFGMSTGIIEMQKRCEIVASLIDAVADVFTNNQGAEYGT